MVRKLNSTNSEQQPKVVLKKIDDVVSNNTRRFSYYIKQMKLEQTPDLKFPLEVYA